MCTSCGSLSECPHDLEVHGGVTTSAPGADAADPENTCEMVVNAAITPGSEIFNTYGSKLTNAELLVRYGFILDANDNDILTWTVEEILDAAGATLDDLQPRRWDDYTGYSACMEILRDWEYDAGWAESELVIDTERSDNRNPLYMTADGVLSHKLWLAIAVATLWRQGTTIDVAQARQLLTRIAWAQIQLEQGQTRVEDDGDDAYEVRGRTCSRCLLARKLTLKKREKSNYVCIKHYNTSDSRPYGTRSFGAQTRVHPAFGDAESAGIGQGGSHDRGIVRAEVGSDFPSGRTTAGRSRFWPA